MNEFTIPSVSLSGKKNITEIKPIRPACRKKEVAEIKSPKEKSLLIYCPQDVYNKIQDWLDEHPGHTNRSAFFCGLKALGVDIPDELLVPKKPRKPRVK